jgi:hypothetical protein
MSIVRLSVIIIEHRQAVIRIEHTHTHYIHCHSVIHVFWTWLTGPAVITWTWLTGPAVITIEYSRTLVRLRQCGLAVRLSVKVTVFECSNDDANK